MTVLALSLLVPWAAGTVLVLLDGRRRVVAWAAVAALAANLALVAALAALVAHEGIFAASSGAAASPSASAASMNCSARSGLTTSALAWLLKPSASSSGANFCAGCVSSPSKSWTVLSYSRRVKRRIGADPGSISAHDAPSASPVLSSSVGSPPS